MINMQLTILNAQSKIEREENLFKKVYMQVALDRFIQEMKKEEESGN